MVIEVALDMEDAASALGMGAGELEAALSGAGADAGEVLAGASARLAHALAALVRAGEADVGWAVRDAAADLGAGELP